MRQVQANGGFATILKRGDETRGALALLIAERGLPKALLERRMTADAAYRWTLVSRFDDAKPEKFHATTDNLTRFDPDCWLIELDIADAERFVAETIASP